MRAMVCVEKIGQLTAIQFFLMRKISRGKNLMTTKISLAVNTVSVLEQPEEVENRHRQESVQFPLSPIRSYGAYIF